jgi:hypothetical protein
MGDRLLLGIGRRMLPLPGPVWRRIIAGRAEATGPALAFMTPDHHRVRNFVVLELPRAGRPLAPDTIAARLGLPPERVVQILDDLERNLTFLYRDADGAVAWAYPVTCAPTPHRLTFSSGERLNAA